MRSFATAVLGLVTMSVVSVLFAQTPAEVNAPLRLSARTVYPDLRWPEPQLIVEVDSRAWHDDPLAQLEDRERQAELEARGERVLRVRKGELRGPARFLNLRSP